LYGRPSNCQRTSIFNLGFKQMRAALDKWQKDAKDLAFRRIHAQTRRDLALQSAPVGNGFSLTRLVSNLSERRLK
jgi:hypothetical protein